MGVLELFSDQIAEMSVDTLNESRAGQRILLLQKGVRTITHKDQFHEIS